MSRKNKNKEMKNNAQAQNQTTASEAAAETVETSGSIAETAVETEAAATETKDAAEETREMFIQFGEHEVSMEAIFEKVKQECTEAWQEEVKDLKVYVKPADNRAYYVLNGEIEGSVGLV